MESSNSYRLYQMRMYECLSDSSEDPLFNIALSSTVCMTSPVPGHQRIGSTLHVTCDGCTQLCYLAGSGEPM
eukprot:3156927-Amphidinium_carterae.1